jgi:hypothetical protein
MSPLLEKLGLEIVSDMDCSLPLFKSTVAAADAHHGSSPRETIAAPARVNTNMRLNFGTRRSQIGTGSFKGSSEEVSSLRW